MTTPQSPWDIWHRRDPDDFHRAAEVEADVCALCNDDDATEREESK